MNVAKLDEGRKRAIHAAICAGKGVGGAAAAARLDRRTLNRLLDGDGGDAFLLGLVPPESITREEWESATFAGFRCGERMAAEDLRRRYVELLREAYGDAIDARLATAAEREAAARRIEKAKAAKAEAERKRKRESEMERRLRLEEERRGEMVRVFGDGYREAERVLNAYALLFGTEEEYRLGLGGVYRTAEREARRTSAPWLLGTSFISSRVWAHSGKSFLDSARKTIQTVERFRARYVADVAAAGLAAD